MEFDLYRVEDRLDAVALQLREAEASGDGDKVAVLRARVAALEEAVLTSKARSDLPSSAFVFPARKGYPIHDRAHGSNALARSAGKPEEGTVRAAVCKRYPDLPACQSKE